MYGDKTIFFSYLWTNKYLKINKKRQNFSTANYHQFVYGYHINVYKKK